MSNVLSMEMYKREKRLNKRLEETRQALRVTKKFYTEIQPLFKYKLMYDMGKQVMQFRKDLLFCIKEINRELKD